VVGIAHALTARSVCLLSNAGSRKRGKGGGKGKRKEEEPSDFIRLLYYMNPTMLTRNPESRAGGEETKGKERRRVKKGGKKKKRGEEAVRFVKSLDLSRSKLL